MEELKQAIEALIEDRDRWRKIAEKALVELQTAVKLLENLRDSVHD
jgi:hypothetical protein